MSTQPQQGGRRPIDRILAPGFAEAVDQLSFPELRERRRLVEQEEVDLSYARRLLQGRLDLLRAEHAARARGEVETGVRSDAELAEELASALADGPRDDHGLGRHINVDPSRVGEYRRRAEQAVADVSASDPSALDDAALVKAIAHLADLEHEVSENRHQVQRVMDTLTAELGRRYASGEAKVEDVLAAE
jgi:hypothetical protein